MADSTTPSQKPTTNTAEVKTAKVVEKKASAVKRADRVPTGIEGFDPLVEGGFPRSSSILVCGGPGTGKSIFCEQFLVEGAKKFGEKGLFVTFEQRKEDVFNQAKQFGWDLQALEEQGLVHVLAIPLNTITKDTIQEIKSMVRRRGITRLVVDSLSTLIINAPIYFNINKMGVEEVLGENIMFSPPVLGDHLIQKFLYSFIDELRDLKDCTALLIGEADQSGTNITRDTLSEFACDGIVLINFDSLGGEYSRSLTVRKMRQTKNNEDVHPMEISSQGIKVHTVA